MTAKNKNLLRQLIKPHFKLSAWDKTFIKSIKLQKFDMTPKQLEVLTKINYKCVIDTEKQKQKRKRKSVVVYYGYNTCK